MEYVDGGNLLDRCRDGAMPLEQALDLACQLCDGLGRAHVAGIVHRDIKPANILITADGIPKLTDFGLAKDESAETGMTRAGAVLGTLDFMPPEQRRDAALTDARSDLWSLAATVYQMVTGKSPKVIRLDLVPSQLTAILAEALAHRTAWDYPAAVRTIQSLPHEAMQQEHRDLLSQLQLEWNESQQAMQEIQMATQNTRTRWTTPARSKCSSTTR